MILFPLHFFILFLDYISFSAHTDYEQTSEFIRILEPPHIVSVSIEKKIFTLLNISQDGSEIKTKDQDCLIFTTFELFRNETLACVDS